MQAQFSHYVECYCTEYIAEWRFNQYLKAECLNVTMLNIFLLNVAMLNIVMLSVTVPNASLF